MRISHFAVNVILALAAQTTLYGIIAYLRHKK